MDKKFVVRNRILLAVAILCIAHPAVATELAAPKSNAVGTNPAGPAFGDFNGDGKLDVAVFLPGNPNIPAAGEVRILFDNGDGTAEDSTDCVTFNPVKGGGDGQSRNINFPADESTYNAYIITDTLQNVAAQMDGLYTMGVK